MQTKAIKNFKAGEQFTLTKEYGSHTQVFTVERLAEDVKLVICRDQNGYGRFFEPEEEYYPIYFSSLDGMPYRG